MTNALCERLVMPLGLFRSRRPPSTVHFPAAGVVLLMLLFNGPVRLCTPIPALVQLVWLLNVPLKVLSTPLPPNVTVPPPPPALEFWLAPSKPPMVSVLVEVGVNPGL